MSFCFVVFCLMISCLMSFGYLSVCIKYSISYYPVIVTFLNVIYIYNIMYVIELNIHCTCLPETLRDRGWNLAHWQTTSLCLSLFNEKYKLYNLLFCRTIKTELYQWEQNIRDEHNRFQFVKTFAALQCKK